MCLSSKHTLDAGGAVTSLQLVTAEPHTKTYTTTPTSRV
jgi:hypothetical protein